MESKRVAVQETVDRLVEDVSAWPHVVAGVHRYGGTEFRVVSRELGHVHGWGMLDIAFLRALRDVLIEEGETGVHHLLAESGWTTYYIESPEEYEHARWLLRLSYLYHVSTLQNTPAGAKELGDVDVDAELAALEPSERVQAVFERQ